MKTISYQSLFGTWIWNVILTSRFLYAKTSQDRSFCGAQFTNENRSSTGSITSNKLWQLGKNHMKLLYGKQHVLWPTARIQTQKVCISFTQNYLMTLRKKILTRYPIKQGITWQLFWLIRYAIPIEKWQQHYLLQNSSTPETILDALPSIFIWINILGGLSIKATNLWLGYKISKAMTYATEALYTNKRLFHKHTKRY